MNSRVEHAMRGVITRARWRRWVTRAVVAGMFAGLVAATPGPASDPAAAAVRAATDAPAAEQRPTDPETLPFHGLGSAAAVPTVPPAAPAAGPAKATQSVRAAAAGPEREIAVAGGGVVSTAAVPADPELLFARPGFAIGDTSLVVYFRDGVVGDTSWVRWVPVVTELESGREQVGQERTRELSRCGAEEYCATLGAAEGWQLRPERVYTVTIRVVLPDGSTRDSLPSQPSQARAVIDPPELPADQASGCSCPNVLTRSPGVQALRADLVNTGTGAYVRTERDAGLSSFGIPFQAVRLYGSTKPRSGMFGAGWSWTYDVAIEPLENGNVRVWAEDGASAVYQVDGDGYRGPVRVQSTLQRRGQGWRLSTADQRRLDFDENGRLTAVINQRGFGVRLAYDQLGRLLTATDAAGRVVRFTTSTDGLITGMTLPDGRSVAYGYTQGLLTSVRDARLLTRYYRYDGQNRLNAVVEADNDVVARIVYGPDARVTSHTDGVGSRVDFSWDERSQTSTARDADGVVTVDEYRRGVLVSTRNGNGDAVNLRYDLSLNRNLAVDAGGNQTTVEHDGDGNVTQVRSPDPFGYVERNSYDRNNNLQSHVDRRGNTWTYEYNDNNDMVRQSDPEQTSGHRYTYDERGLVLTRTDALDKVTRYEYDAQGNRTAEVTPTGRRTEFRYDSVGRLTEVIDPRGTGNVSALTRLTYTTRLAYDADDRVLSRLEPGKKLPSLWVYDVSGQVIKVVDPLLRSTRWERDAAGRVTAVLDPKSRATRYDYTPAGRVRAVTDALGGRTSWEYESRGRIRTELSPRGNALAASGADAETIAQYTTTFAYDAAGNLRRSSRPYPGDPSKTVQVDARFDALNRPITQIDELGSATRMSYDEADNIVGMTDEKGRSLGYRYDKANRRIGGTDADGRSAGQITYDDAGNVTAQRSPTGGLTTWRYDDDGRPIAITEPRGNVAGADPADFTTRYAYDLAGNLTTVTDPLGNVSRRSYDATDRPFESTDANGNVTRAVYDDADQVVAVFGPTAAGTAQDYLADFTSAASRISGKGPVSGTVLAPGSSLSLTSFALASVAGLKGVPVTRYGYDATGQMVASADQLGRIRSVGYDALDRPITQTDPLGRTKRMSYDPDGNVIATRVASNTPELLLNDRDRAAATTTYTYNPVGRLTARTLGTDGPRYSYGYDPSGRMTSMADPTGSTTIDYDETGLVTRVARGSREFTYGYDEDDNITSRTYPDGTRITAQFDVGNRMEWLQTQRGSGTQRFDFEYDVADRLVTTRYPLSADAQERLVYDRAGRLTGVRSGTGDGVSSVFDLTRDAVGNPTQISTSRSDGGGAATVAETTAYSYDASNRLTAACYAATGCGKSDKFAEKYAYEYDLVGNRTKQVYTKTGGGPLGLPAVTTTAYHYDKADQLSWRSSVGAKTEFVSYQYDGEGNQTRAGEDRFTYNLDHTVASATVDGKASTFAYDAAGNRIASTTGAAGNQQTRFWEWDTLNALPMLAVESAASGDAQAGPAGGRDAATVRAYTYGQAGQTLALHSGQASASSGSLYLHDWLGGTAAVVGADGAGQWAYSYDPFGSPRGENLVAGGRRLAASAPANPLQFTGGYNDEAAAVGETGSGSAGNYHLRARDYDPANGRFTGVDPVSRGAGSVGISAYSYANARPGVLTDPSGQVPEGGGPVVPLTSSVTSEGEDSGIQTGNALTPEYQEALDALNAQRTAAQQSLREAESFVKQLGDEIVGLILDLVGVTDARRCVQDGDVGSCVMTVLNAVPWGKLFKAAKVMVKAVGLGRRLVDGFGRLRSARAAVQALAQQANRLALEGARASRKALEAAKAAAARRAAQARAAAQRSRELAAQAAAQAAKARVALRAAKENALRKVQRTRRPGKTCNSFAGDVRVVMADGSLKPIAQVRAGDAVAAGPASSADEQQAVVESAEVVAAGDRPVLASEGAEGAGGVVSRQVTSTVVGSGVKDLVALEFVGAGGGGGGPPVVATDGHPFWTVERGWVRAGQLRVGEHVTGPGGGLVELVGLGRDTRAVTVYNLGVDERHTYYVVAAGGVGAPVLVHNSGGADFCPISGAAKSDPLLDFAQANRTADSRFASEYTSESGAKYYDTNLPGGRANPYDHHGGCAEIGCLLQAQEAEGSVSGGSMRTVYNRPPGTPIPPGPPQAKVRRQRRALPVNACWKRGDRLVAPEPWHEVLDRLDNAGSDQEAQQATAELIDVVLEGGVAVSENAEGVSAAILLNPGLRGNLRVYLLWVLFEISRCLGLWGSADRQADTPNVHAGAEREARVAARLAEGYPVYVSLMSDAESSVRSLASLLTALCTPEPTSSARLLAAQDREEDDVLAKACALQALLVALARTPREKRELELVEHVRGRARSGSPEDRGRLRRVIAGNSGVSLPQHAHEVLAEVVPLLSDPEGPYWPIELL